MVALQQEAVRLLPGRLNFPPPRFRENLQHTEIHSIALGILNRARRQPGKQDASAEKIQWEAQEGVRRMIGMKGSVDIIVPLITWHSSPAGEDGRKERSKISSIDPILVTNSPEPMPNHPYYGQEARHIYEQYQEIYPQLIIRHGKWMAEQLARYQRPLTQIEIDAIVSKQDKQKERTNYGRRIITDHVSPSNIKQITFLEVPAEDGTIRKVAIVPYLNRPAFYGRYAIELYTADQLAKFVDLPHDELLSLSRMLMDEVLEPIAERNDQERLMLREEEERTMATKLEKKWRRNKEKSIS